MTEVHKILLIPEENPQDTDQQKLTRLNYFTSIQ